MLQGESPGGVIEETNKFIHILACPWKLPVAFPPLLDTCTGGLALLVSTLVERDRPT